LFLFKTARYLPTASRYPGFLSPGNGIFPISSLREAYNLLFSQSPWKYQPFLIGPIQIIYTVTDKHLPIHLLTHNCLRYHKDIHSVYETIVATIMKYFHFAKSIDQFQVLIFLSIILLNWLSTLERLSSLCLCEGAFLVFLLPPQLLQFCLLC
jgi:hypothetical protein